MKKLMYMALAMAAPLALAQSSSVPSMAPAPPALHLTLPGFADGGRIPNRYTCMAGPSVVSPEMHWSAGPAGTLSYVLVFHDLDPHPGHGLLDNPHWVLWNIPANSTGLAEGVPAGASLADGMHQMQRARTIPGSFYSYYGPCALDGPDHHYVFELYALDTQLHLADDATRAEILKAADGHILAAGAWFGYFHQTRH